MVESITYLTMQPVAGLLGEWISYFNHNVLASGPQAWLGDSGYEWVTGISVTILGTSGSSLLPVKLPYVISLQFPSKPLSKH